MIEKQETGILCSILLTDDAGQHTGNAIGPSMSEAFVREREGCWRTPFVYFNLLQSAGSMQGVILHIVSPGYDARRISSRDAEAMPPVMSGTIRSSMTIAPSIFTM